MSGIPSWARPGAKVVFVDATPPLETSLVVGATYVVVEISQYMCINGPYQGERGISVAGRPGVFWAIPRFRPAVEDADELSLETIIYRQKGRKSKSPVREKERA